MNVIDGIASVFRSEAQGELLALILGGPDREWTQAELAQRTGVSQATVSRELGRLVGSGLVDLRAVGRTRLALANTSHPLYPEFRRIVDATFGVPAIIDRVFGQLDAVDAIILFGSWEARAQGNPGPPPADIDVLLLGAPTRTAAYTAAERAESLVSLPVQPTIRPTAAWFSADPFLVEVRHRPHRIVRVADHTDSRIEVGTYRGEIT